LEKIEDQLMDSLNRVNFIFKNEEMITECIKAYDGFSILGEAFGPFEISKKYKLKYFVALPFIENDIMKISLDEKCDNFDVQRYAISERDDQRLIQRDNPYFLNKIKEFKKFIEKDVYDKNKPKKGLDLFKSFNINIIDSRLSKMLRLARSELSVDDEHKLTNSEKLLYKKLSNLIKVWRAFFLSID
jgi:hypothetical protein